MVGAHPTLHDFNFIHPPRYSKTFLATMIYSATPEPIPTPIPKVTTLDVSPSVYSTFNLAPNQVSTPDIDFYWHVFNDGTNDLFDAVIVSRNTNGWVGFGISPHGIMDGSDMLICRMESSSIIVEDRIAYGYSVILDINNGGKNDILNFGMSRYPETDGSMTTVCRIQRKLDTGDASDLPLFQNTACNSFYILLYF